MPNNLIFVRHGQSEANVLQQASKSGDDSRYTDEMFTVPDRSWRLTNLGIHQANLTGEWLQEQLPNGFDRYFVSPYTRTRETAAHLALPNAKWRENRIVRERFWGEIGSIPKSLFEKEYPRSYSLKQHDPLYWCPPGGESIAEVGDCRVHGLLDTLHREASEKNIIVVTHGEFMWASMLRIERWSDEEFVKNDKDPRYKIHNGMVLHYTRINPKTGEQASKLKWVRKAYPYYNRTSAKWEMVVSDWQKFDRQELSNEDLLTAVNFHPNRLFSGELA